MESRLREIKNLSAELANRPLVTQLKDLVEWKMGEERDEKLLKEIDDLITFQHKSIFMELPNFPGYKLTICFSRVPQDYVARIDVPDDKVATELIKQYNFMKASAVGYWDIFCKQHKKFFDKLKARFPDTNFVELYTSPKNPTVLYFEEGCPRRTGIFPYYVDKGGSPLRKDGKE